MFKALTATAAVIVCCLGNEYPAKADYYQQLQLDRQQREMEWRIDRMERNQRFQQRMEQHRRMQQQRYSGGNY